MTYRVHGKLELRFSRSADQTILRVNQQRPPLQVVRAFRQSEATALVHLHSVSGGVLGGDRLELNVEIAPDARVQLTTTSATRLYRSRENAPPAYQTNTIRLHENSYLEYLPDSLIPFAGSRYQQQTQITLQDKAALIWWEVIAPGREARGESFAYDFLQLDTEISADSHLIVRERLKLKPRLRSLNSLVRLGNYRYMGTCYLCKVGEAASVWSALEMTLQEKAQAFTSHDSILWGVSTLPAHGLIIRALSLRERDIYTGLHEFWREAKRILFGREATLPRKIY